MSNPSSLPALSGADSGWYPPDSLSASSTSINFPAPRKDSTFCLRNTTLTRSEEQNLKSLGYSTADITRAQKALAQRNITPTHSGIVSYLQSGHAYTLGTTKECIDSGLSATAGVQGKLRLMRELQGYTKNCVKTVTEQFNRHYSSFWPDRQGIVTMVNKWPEALHKQAAVICQSWPELLVGNAVQVNFNSSIGICSDELNRKLAPLECQAFFQLVKDIWVDALRSKNSCAIDRVSHLLISFTWEISHNLYYFHGRSPTHDRLERFEQMVQQMLQVGISSIDDIDAFAFMLVTKPHTWRTHKSNVMQLMVSRALQRQDLSPLFARWQGDPDSHEQITKTVETEIIDTVTAMHYLDDIHGYLMQYSDKRPGCSESNQITNAEYFDPVTRQLKTPILAHDITTRPSHEETRAALLAYFNCTF